MYTEALETCLRKMKRPWCQQRTRLDKPVRGPENIKTLISVRGAKQQDFEGLLWGRKIWQARPVSYQTQGPHQEKGNVRGWIIKAQGYCEASPRTIPSLANRAHWRKKQHTLKGSPPCRPKEKNQHRETAMRAWWRSNSRRGCHLRI